MKKLISLALTLAVLLAAALPAAALSHGTSDVKITEDMLQTEIPEGYTVHSATQADAKDGVYNDYFLKDELQVVNITVDENNLNYLLQNAADEPSVLVESVSIGDTTVNWCGMKTKGNYTLYHSYHDNAGSDRFSFTVNFGKYVTKEEYGEKQTFYGCTKISFNNFFFDKSMMKEYCAFMLMKEMGLPTPQFGLAKLYINGEYYGVYFMIEALDDTVLEQYWQVDGKELSSYLTKPTGTALEYYDLQDDDGPLYGYDEETYAKVEDMLPTVMAWSRKLTLLSKGKDFSNSPIDVQSEEYIALLEEVLDLDECIKYFAVSSWLCQLDNMFTNYQNFGLYVSQEGKATLIPWDYDLAFGCYYPSSAQNTANYPIDVMYRLDLNRADQESKISDQTYKEFPLFYVIYQNDELMERYHAYMAECSQIAALGGTVASTGKSYEPGFLNSCIETLSDSLIAAASEPTADNVYYMNGINQPKDVEKALPNLSAIIAQRAVGVWVQVKGIDTTVCAAGCNLETLGNAITGEFPTSGTLTTVDATTGIFVTAEYSGDRRAGTPQLKVTQADPEQLPLETGKRDKVLAWNIQTTVLTTSDYQLTVPLSPEYLGEGTTVTFYQYTDGTMQELEMTQDGNLFSCQLTALGTVAVRIQGAGTQEQSYWLLYGATALLLLAAVAAGATGLIRRRKARTAQ